MAKSKDSGAEDDMGVPDMKAFKTMCDSIASYRAKHAENDIGPAVDECMAVFNIEPVKVPTPPGAPAPVTGKPSNPDASVDDPKANFAALKGELTTELTASFSTLLDAALEKNNKAQQVEFQKQMSALGMKPAPVKEPTAEEIATAKKQSDAELASRNGGATDFLSLKAARAKEKNIKPADAAREIMTEQPEAYRQYQIKLGLIRG